MEPPNARPDGQPAIAADRLLAAMHQACSHDLPNQILSLQSLIHLMDMDETLPAAAASHEYLRRLKGVAEKTAGLTDFLKAMVRLARYEPQPRDLSLPDLFREVAIEAKRRTDPPLTWDVRRLSGSVRVDRDLVYPSLGDLVQALAAGGAKTVTVASSYGKEKWTIEIAVGSPTLQMSTTQLEQRCDFLLARERLHAAGIDLRLGPTRGNEANVVLDFPAERT